MRNYSLTLALSLLSVSAFAAPPRAGQTDAAADQHAAVQKQASVMQQHYDYHQRILQQRLQQAEAHRQKALQADDFAALKKIEQYERQAFAEYERNIGQMNKRFSGEGVQAPAAAPAGGGSNYRQQSIPQLKPQSGSQASPSNASRKSGSWFFRQGWLSKPVR